jgi:hypothetical protein
MSVVQPILGLAQEAVQNCSSRSFSWIPNVPCRRMWFSRPSLSNARDVRMDCSSYMSICHSGSSLSWIGNNTIGVSAVLVRHHSHMVVSAMCAIFSTVSSKLLQGQWVSPPKPRNKSGRGPGMVCNGRWDSAHHSRVA